MYGWITGCNFRQEGKTSIEMYGIVSRLVVLALCQRHQSNISHGQNYEFYRVYRVQGSARSPEKAAAFFGFSSSTADFLAIILYSFVWTLDVSIADYFQDVYIFYRDADCLRFAITSHASFYRGALSLIQLRTYHHEPLFRY